ncbi:PREDICTED: universal stress [Prunus dulcis]|uniref:PREDICTED: universal stress n=1 Tax=Prunus dulcis TaxID=3755 RepID=A0A5E4EM64_PRUDU|nr:universal stress protein PHOS32 [Prunus dulcis]VVA16773.1 PREDICTED: universal stress [Prunus dulcis]
MAEGSENKGKPLMLVAVDDSEHSFYALEWTLDHFFAHGTNHPFKLIVIHARSSASSALGVAGFGSVDFMTYLEADMKKSTSKTVQKAQDVCTSKKVENVEVEVMEGDPRNVMCDAVDKHQASLLVVGSHGYGIVKRAVLGSVSDYCAHHVKCSVMIVKKPTKP